VFNSDSLEVAIGIIFVYLLMSSLATAAREAFEGFLKKRGQYLELGLKELFFHDTDPAKIRTPDQTFLARFYNHHLIFSLYQGNYIPPCAGPNTLSQQGRKNLPSYIPSDTFVQAFLDVASSYLRPGTDFAALTPDRLRAAAWAIPNPPLRKTLLQALNTADGDIAQLREFLKTWFDNGMDRVTGWYKRHTNMLVFWGSLTVAVAMNVNTLLIGQTLYQEPALRAVVETAAQQSKDFNDSGAPNIAATLAKTQSLGLPVGWGEAVRAHMITTFSLTPLVDDASGANGTDPLWLCAGLLELLAGWLMTAYAMTLGAPFWFDILNKAIQLRTSLKPDSGGKAAAPASQTRHFAATPPKPPPADDVGNDLLASLDPAERLGIDRRLTGIVEAAL
jgi:hypothetical protein